MKKTGLILIAFMCISNLVFGQMETKTTVFSNQNIVHGTLGFGGLWATLNLNYERQLTTTNSKIFRTVGFRAGGGYWATWGQEGPHFILTPVFVSGTKNNHFESSIGATLLYDKLSYDIGVSNANYFGETPPSKTEYMDIYPSGTLGYRYQKPDGWFVFRTGVGFPDIVYLGLGVAF